MGLLDALKSALGLGSRDREPDTESRAEEPAVESEAAVKGTDHVDESAAGSADETAETPGKEASIGAATSDTSTGTTGATRAAGATGTAGSVEGGDDTGETTGTDTSGSAVAGSDATASEPVDTDAPATDATAADATDTDAESRTDADDPGVEDAEPAATEEADPAVTDDEEQADTEDGRDTGDDGDAAAAELPPGVADEPVDSVNGVGPAYAARLEKAGVGTVGDLVAADAATVAEESEIAASRIERWQERARDV